jgi:Bacterial Ig-like domain
VIGGKRGAAAGAAGLLIFGLVLVGTASAAAPSEQSVTPAAGATVQATRPTITVTFDENLDQTSTLGLLNSGDLSPISCPRAISQKTISCTPGVDLKNQGSYTIVVHAVDAATKAASDPDPTSFTVAIPAIRAVTPSNGLLGDGANGHADTITASYTSGIYHNAVAHFYRLNSDGSLGTEVPLSAPTYSGGSTTPGFETPDSAVTVTPTGTLSVGSYALTLHVDMAQPDSTGLSQGTDVPAAYASDVLDFTVPAAPTPPSVTQAAPYIDAANQAKVPFSGSAPAGQTITVTIGSASAHVDVATCSNASCPWSLTVDASGLADGTYSWTADAHNPNGDAATAPQSIVKDTTPPAVPTLTATISGNTVTATMTDSDATTATYDVTVTDSTTATTTMTDIAADSSDPSRKGTAAVDISGLVDGTLTVTAKALDAPYGNPSAASTAVTGTKESVLTAPAFARSYFTVGSTNRSFNATGGNTWVQLPKSITLEFNEPIRAQAVQHHYSNLDPTGTLQCPPASTTCTDTTTVNFASGMQVVDANGQQVAGTISMASDGRGITFTPNGPLADGQYAITHVIGAAATCPDEDATNQSGYSCEHYDSLNPQAGQPGDPVTTFTVDTVAPHAPTVTMPSTITAKTVKWVTISGTAEPASTIAITIASSDGGTTYLAHGGQPIAVNSRGAWSTVENLSNVRDGTLTVKATATDRAGNQSPAARPSPTPVLRAHLTTLTETVSAGNVKYGAGVRLSGVLTDSSTGVRIAGATITVRPRYDNGSYGTARDATTNSKGVWALAEKPSYNSTWYAHYAGSTVSGALHDAANAHSARTLVRVAIAFTSPASGSRVGSPVTLKGEVSPDKAGSYVSFYEKRSSGTVKIGSAKLDKYSHWTFRFSVPSGNTYVYATIGNTAGNLGNRTAWLSLVH